jgi:hypothetical protein
VEFEKLGNILAAGAGADGSSSGLDSVYGYERRWVMCECYGMEGDPMAMVSMAVVGHRIDEQNWEIIRLNAEVAKLKRKIEKLKAKVKGVK